jgi:hypothetical protein
LILLFIKKNILDYKFKPEASLLQDILRSVGDGILFVKRVNQGTSKIHHSNFGIPRQIPPSLCGLFLRVGE